MAFLPFARPHIDEETIAAVGDTLRSGWITSGPKVVEFEGTLSRYLQGRPVRVFNSATSALEVALAVCNIGSGDEVITPAQSFFATANVISRAGARPVFVDVDLATRNLLVDQVRRAITPRSKAILPVHFGGLAADMDGIHGLAKQHRLRVIEDAALAMGASYRERRIGAFGDIAAFSFHPNKNMTTIEGGALSFASEDDAKRAEQWRFHGITRLEDGTRDVDVPGGKSNLPDVNATIGLAQLRHLEEWNRRRRQLAQRYFDRLITDPSCVLPARGDDGHCWNLFAVLLPLKQLTISRKQFIDAMGERGIGIGISYEAIHLTSFHRRYGYGEGDFPNSERIGRETVTLPLFPQMSEDDVDRVCGAIQAIFRGARR